jgi:hypothetical protein
MKTIMGMLILCVCFGIIGFIGMSVALYLLCKDIDIDDVMMGEEDL